MEQDLDVRVKVALEEIRRTQRTLADKSARPFYQDSLELLSRKYADIHKRYVPRIHQVLFGLNVHKFHKINQFISAQ